MLNPNIISIVFFEIVKNSSKLSEIEDRLSKQYYRNVTIKDIINSDKPIKSDRDFYSI